MTQGQQRKRLCSGSWMAGVALIALTGMSACRKAPPPPPPPPAPIVVPRQGLPNKTVTLPDAPPIASTPDTTAPPSVQTEAPVLQPPATKRRRPRVAKKVDPKRTAEEVRTAENRLDSQSLPNEVVTPPPPTTPQLGQMLSPQESKEFNQKLDLTADRVKNTVAIIQTKPLSEEQKEVVGRIRNFLAQAEQAREQDLVSAVNLAERADLLSRDLLERLR